MLMVPGHAPRTPHGDEAFGNGGQDQASSHREGTQGGGQAEVALMSHLNNNKPPSCFPDGDNYKELFGALDNAFLVAYAIGMFIRYPGPFLPHTSLHQSVGNWFPLGWGHANRKAARDPLRIWLLAQCDNAHRWHPL